ncbi:hypothetical protein GF362_05340 [Candidatus Dojkabacteria bacterium]|nr:hypothetical protein [Candidatus Dojkabacteria bacterium]
MSVILTIVILTLIFGILVGLHELGHFLAAKLQGVWVQEFSFGFGPTLFSKQIGETKYKISLIPMGGYVKLFGEQSILKNKDLLEEFEGLEKKFKEKIHKLIKKHKLGNIKDDEKLKEKITGLKDIPQEEKDWMWIIEMSKKERLEDVRRYSNQPVWRRLIIVCGGPLMNFLLGIFVYFIYLSLVSGQVVIPKWADYNFLGADYRSVLTTYVPASNPKEKFQETLILKINNHFVTELQELKDIIDQNIDEEVHITFFKIREGRFKEESIVLDNETIDLLFSDYFLLDRPYLTEVLEEEPASIGGLEKEDIILSVNDQEVYYDNLKSVLENFKGKSVDIKIYRQDKGILNMTDVELNDPESNDEPILGTRHVNYVPFDVFESYYLNYKDSILGSVYHSVNMIGFQVRVLSEFIQTAIETKDPGLLVETVSGPIRVGAEVNTLVKGDNFIDIINLTGLISLTLAFMNLLPLPVVDGGHVVLLIFEKIRGRPLSERSQQIYNIIGLVFIIGLSLLVTLKDIWTVFFS